ncbi:MAG: RidA family protein [Kiloniellales bacterium]|nr:RidA family protein [Kiloniellales bacterium]
MSKTVTYLNPPGAPAPLGLYSNVAIAEPGRLAFIAGQVAVDAAGEIVGPHDVAAQTPVVLDNIGLILADLGIGFSEVLEFTTYIVGPESREPWLAARTAAYDRLFPEGNYPANTLLIIGGLARPELMVEVSAVARLPG